MSLSHGKSCAGAPATGPPDTLLDLTVVHVRGTASRCPARNPCHAHRRQRTPDDGVEGGDEAVQASIEEALADLEAKGANHRGQQEKSNAFDHGQCPLLSFFSAKMLGSSSKS